MLTARLRPGARRWIVGGVLVTAGLFVLFASPDRADSEEGASAGDIYGPLADGEAKSHEDLIRTGWVYLFDSRIPPESTSLTPSASGG